jgi:hypothetical protein
MRKLHALLLLVIISLSSLLSLPHITVNADSSNTSNINCKLTTTSPNSNTVYVETMPLNFTMNWTVNTVVPFMYLNMSYSIDDKTKISINDGNNISFDPSAQGYAFHYRYIIFPPANTSTNSNIDISMLSGGAHKLILYADGFYNVNNDFIYTYNFSSNPIYFSVNFLATSSTPSPTPKLPPTTSPTPNTTSTPTVPELSWLVIVPLLLSVIAVALVLRHRKTGNVELKKKN